MFCAPAAASTLKLTGTADTAYVYDGIAVGPYAGDKNGVSGGYYFCLDEKLTANWQTTYTGTWSLPSGEAEEEAALLASYLLSKTSPSGNRDTINAFEGPISFAIWEIMGTLGGDVAPDPAAQVYIDFARNVYHSPAGIPTAILSSAYIFNSSTSGIQRFVTAVNDNNYFQQLQATPEPGTVILMGAGLLALCLAVARRRTSEQ